MARGKGKGTEVAVAASPLKRSSTGSAYERCEKCDKNIAAALFDIHDCEEARKREAIVERMTKQAVKKNDDAKMAKLEKKNDDATKGTKRKVAEPKAVIKKSKKAKEKDPNAPKRPPSGFFVFMETFRKEYKDANPNSKGVAVMGKAAGEKWKKMSEEEKAGYNNESKSRKVTYDQDMINYNNKKDDGEVSEDAADEDDDEANVDDE